MRTLFAAVFLMMAPPLGAQSLRDDAVSVSLYQLEHKTTKDAHRLFERAAQEVEHRDYESSIPLLLQALKLDPDYWDAENELGCVYLHLGRQEEAEKEFQRAIEIDPENGGGYVNRGIVALRKSDYKLAEQCAAQAMRLSPNLPQGEALMAIAQVDQARWTPYAHRLLEQASASIPAVSDLLRIWPNAKGPAPKVTVQISATN